MSSAKPVEEKSKAVDYQYGPYCSLVAASKEKKYLSKLANFYDDVFKVGHAVDHHTLSALGDSLGLEDNVHAKWWVARGGIPMYGYAAYKELQKLNLKGAPLTPALVGKGAKAVTWDALTQNKPFRMWFSAWLSLTQVLRGPDEILDNVGFEQTTGWQREAGYWGTFVATLGLSLYFVNLDYSTILRKNPDGSPIRISRKAQLAWSLGWLLYTGYQYGKVDQREALRMEGKDPDLADNPLNWKKDNHVPNRLNSSYTSWAADAVWWAEAPRASRWILDKLVGGIGRLLKKAGVSVSDRSFGGYQALSFDAAEKAGLRTLEEKTYLERAPKMLEAVKTADAAVLRKRLWYNMKLAGRFVKTIAKTPRRPLYSVLWWATNVGLVSIPLSRVQQYARAVTEGKTLHGVGSRPIFSSLLNYAGVNPLKWAGFDASGYGFYSPGMAAVVYPWDGCNEIPTAAHQMALAHLEKFRWQDGEENKAAEKALFKKYFSQSDPKDREKDIEKFGKIVPELFE